MTDMEKGRPQRGVTLFSYSDLLGVCMTLEDCFRDIYDMGVTRIEILAGHVEDYPTPSTQWIDEWFRLCEKYDVAPGEFGHWYDTRVYQDRYLDVEESLEYLEADFKLARSLGFGVLRTKLTARNTNCDPVPGWQEYMKRAIELAERYDVKMCSEVHRPTVLTTGHIDDFLEFIETTGTRHFGFNVDFGTFQNTFPESLRKKFQSSRLRMPETYSEPADIVRVLPYTYACHAKFNYMDENFEEVTIPYAEVISTLVDNGWSGPLLAEYEGLRKDEPDFLFDQLRRHQIMLKRLLGY